jgi:hypothetical protein
MRFYRWAVLPAFCMAFCSAQDGYTSRGKAGETVLALDAGTLDVNVPIYPPPEKAALGIIRSRHEGTTAPGEAPGGTVTTRREGGYLVSLSPRGDGRFEYEVGPLGFTRVIWRIILYRPGITARMVSGRSIVTAGVAQSALVYENGNTKLILRNPSPHRSMKRMRWQLRVGSDLYCGAAMCTDPKSWPLVEFDGPGERSIDLPLKAASFVDPATGKPAEGGVETVLSLRHEELTGDSPDARDPAATRPLGAQELRWTALWKPAPPDRNARLVAFLFALLGVVASYATGFWVPHLKRNQDLGRSLAQLGARIREIPIDLGSALEAGLRSEKLALDARRNAISTIWPSYRQLATELQGQIASLSTRVGLAERLSRESSALRELDRVSNSPLSRYVEATEKLEAAGTALRWPETAGEADAMMQKAAVLLEAPSTEETESLARTLQAKIEKIRSRPVRPPQNLAPLLAILENSEIGLSVEAVRRWARNHQIDLPTALDLQLESVQKQNRNYTAERFRQWLPSSAIRFAPGIAPLLAEMERSREPLSGERLLAWIEETGVGAIDVELTLCEAGQDLSAAELAVVQLPVRPSLALAAATLQQIAHQKLHTAEMEVAAMLQEKRARIAVDREGLRVNEPIVLSLELELERLRAVAPQTKLVPTWKFGEDRQLYGWTVTRYFTVAGDYPVRVEVAGVEFLRSLHIAAPAARDRNVAKQLLFIGAGVLPVLIALVYRADDLSWMSMLTLGFTTDKIKEALAGKDS